MKLVEYIEQYGHLTFQEKPLNEVDKLLFANISYVNFKNLLSKDDTNKKTMKQITKEFYQKKYHEEDNIISIKGGIKLLKLMSEKERYKDLLLYNFEHIVDEEQQFQAVTIEIDKNLIYVSFEGTDKEMIGWEEDFLLSYKFPIKSQKSAKKYLNKHFLFKNKNIILGGHSKGGNLALVAAMYCNPLIKNKIKEIYSYDGPGLLEKYLNKRRYKKIEKRFNHVVPKNSFIGMMLYSNNLKVVDTKYVGLFSHYALNWQVDENDLMYTELGNSSIELHQSISNWIKKYNNKQKELFVKEMFDVFRKNKIYTLIDFMKRPSSLIKIISYSNKVSKNTNEMFSKFVSMTKKFMLKSIKETIKKQ